MNFVRYGLGNNIHPCFPIGNRVENCLINAHFPQECNALYAEYRECNNQDLLQIQSHNVSKQTAASDIWVPPFYIVNDRFEGMAADETLRIGPKAPN